jgi:putative flippase GtrA
MIAQHAGAAAGWHRFVRFLLVGGGATLLQYVLLVLFVHTWLPNAVAASTLAYVISAQCNYLANRAFTFRSDRPHASALPRFIVVTTIGLGLNAAVVWLAADGLKLHYLLAQAFATVATLCWNYVASLRWAFATDR